MSSIRNRLLLVLLAAGLLPLAFVFVVTKTITSRELEQSERGKISAVGNEIARQIATSMERASNDLESLRFNPLVVGPNTPLDDRLEEMRRLVRAYDSFTDITLYDATGLMIKSTTDRNHPEPVDRTSWLARARDEGTVTTSPPHMVIGQEGLHIKVYIPVYIDNTAEPHILKARLTFAPVWNLIDGALVGKNGEMLLVDIHGKILASRNKDLILEKFDERYPSSFWTTHPKGNYDTPDGRRYAYCAQTLPGHLTYVRESWVVLSLLPAEELTAALHHSESYQYLAGVVAMLGITLMGLTISRRLAQPVVLASNAAKKVALGDLDARVPESGPLEMKQLATSFNQMIVEVKDSRQHLESLVDSRTRKLRESQSELEALTSQLRAAYESTREAILVVQPDGTIIAANNHIQEFFGIDPSENIAALPFERFMARVQPCFPEDSDPASRWKLYESNPTGIVEEEWAVTAPEERMLSVYTAPVKNHRGESISRLWMFRDVTEQRRLEQGLQQAQKLEAVGRLAGGIAHDFNNLLTGIIGNLSLAQMEGEDSAHGDPQRFIASAKKAGQRAAELVRQLLGFSRRSHLQLAQTDVNDLALEIQDLLVHTIDPRVSIDVDLPDGLWHANADATQIQQVVMNMCVNAVDAMQEDGGRIQLSTRNVQLTEEQASMMSMGAPAGKYVRISVQDNGHGMPPEIRERIFEPFFTTKDPGKGTGLGLATSYGIIRQHGGWIVCESEVGQGTHFLIYLPGVEATTPIAQAEDTPTEIHNGSETVLLVDDEQVVRAVAQGALERHGYTILCASDGEEALSICREQGADIDAIILDLTMPRLSGRETFIQLQETENPPPVILCSGYMVDLDTFEQETGTRPAGAVQKPFNLDQLSQAVRSAVDDEKAAATASPNAGNAVPATPPGPPPVRADSEHTRFEG